jgi:hypothetical protein
MSDFENQEVVSWVITVLMFLLLIFVLAFLICYLIRYDTRHEPILHQWAAKHGYRILDWEARWYFTGPYFWTNLWTPWNGRAVFYVTVADAHGNARHCWVRWGSRLFGVFSDKIDVVWEENGLEPRT